MLIIYIFALCSSLVYSQDEATLYYSGTRKITNIGPTFDNQEYPMLLKIAKEPALNQLRLETLSVMNNKEFTFVKAILKRIQGNEFSYALDSPADTKMGQGKATMTGPDWNWSKIIVQTGSPEKIASTVSVSFSDKDLRGVSFVFIAGKMQAGKDRIRTVFKLVSVSKDKYDARILEVKKGKTPSKNPFTAIVQVSETERLNNKNNAKSKSGPVNSNPSPIK